MAEDYKNSFNGATTTKAKLAIKAEEVASWVTSMKIFGKPIGMTGANIPEQLAKRTGIVFLGNFQGLDDTNQRFKHIDLWNGHAHRMSVGFRWNGWFDTATRVTFWEFK